MSNRTRFKETYAKHLKAVRISKPEYYVWPMSDLELVTGRMQAAIDAGSYNKDSLAFKHTCKELGLKHTYKAIRAYINETA